MGSATGSARRRSSVKLGRREVRQRAAQQEQRKALLVEASEGIAGARRRLGLVARAGVRTATPRSRSTACSSTTRALHRLFAMGCMRHVIFNQRSYILSL